MEMNDRDEAIRELQTEIENATYPDRPRRFMFPLLLAEKVLELLKEQEPVKPIIDTYWETPSEYDNDVKVTENKCGACGAEIDKWDKYCRVCGRTVKWE